MIKSYDLPNERKMTAEFDENGIGKITVQALDSLVSELNHYATPCEDAVSRQAVLDGIEELKQSPWATDKRGNGFEYLITEALDMVAFLCVKQEPSVRPQESKIGHWIPISEKLPEDGTWNLFTDGRKVSVERYKADALDHFYPNGRCFSLEEAIAWMPLPEPYKVQKNGDAE